MQIKVKIIKSARKSMSLTIDNNANLVARVPYNYDKQKLNNFINEKSNWIVKHIKQVEESNQKHKQFELANGVKIVLFEHDYIIKITKTSHAKMIGDIIVLPDENSKEFLIALLKKYAKKHLTSRVQQLASLYGFSYLNIKVGGAKTVWGSCSSNNSLNFTYKLLFTPNIVVDYIIIHELSHTKVKNHSKKFYQTVANCMPNYKQAEQWLKQNKSVINYL